MDHTQKARSKAGTATCQRMGGRFCRRTLLRAPQRPRTPLRHSTQLWSRTARAIIASGKVPRPEATVRFLVRRPNGDGRPSRTPRPHSDPDRCSLTVLNARLEATPHESQRSSTRPGSTRRTRTSAAQNCVEPGPIEQPTDTQLSAAFPLPLTRSINRSAGYSFSTVLGERDENADTTTELTEPIAILVTTDASAESCT